MTNLTDLLAAGTEVVVGGVPLTLRKATLAESGAFAKWLKDRAKREACVFDPQTPEDAAERYIRATSRDVNGLYYEPGGPGYIAAMHTPDGMAEFLYLVLRTDHPQITRDQVRTLIEDGLAREYLRVIELEKEDPKVAAAVLRFLGLPPDYLTSLTPSSSDSPTPHSTGDPGRSDG